MISKQALIELDRLEVAARNHVANVTIKSINAVPTKSSLVRRYHKSHLYKALGESGVGAEARRLCPELVAELFAPLHVKACLSSWTPIDWRGSLLHALYNLGNTLSFAAYSVSTVLLIVAGFVSLPTISFLRESDKLTVVDDLTANR